LGLYFLPAGLFSKLAALKLYLPLLQIVFVYFDGKPCNDVLDGAGEDVPIVRQAGGEGGAVIEGELRLPLGLLQGGLERVQLLPQLGGRMREPSRRKHRGEP
jgi:hypothetical protein